MTKKLPTIKQTKLTTALRNRAYAEFAQHAIESTGTNDLKEPPVAFCLRAGRKLVGCAVSQTFWGQLHIKYLWVDKAFRGRGYGRQLMERAFEHGRERGCTFAYVETMSFQAPEFYKKCGFRVELKRDGYSNSTSFYYLRRDLD